jgi:hypothetical protein
MSDYHATTTALDGVIFVSVKGYFITEIVYLAIHTHSDKACHIRISSNTA